METITTAKELRERIKAARDQGRKIALIPTMGALHAGHMSLLAEGEGRGCFTVLSIFVNPLQFNNAEDLEKYPRTLEADTELAAENGADLLFVPASEEIYPSATHSKPATVKAGSLAANFEGQFRPGHFDGVVTVVSILFALVQPDFAIFGEKDFQQLQVIREMTKEHGFNIEIVGAPILRDPDGLAMSSRNRRLTSEQRTRALSIPLALDAACRRFAQGERNAHSVIRMVKHRLEGEAALKVDYVVAVNPATLKEVPELTSDSRMLVAAWVDGVRLIDTASLGFGFEL